MDIAVATRPVQPDDRVLFRRLWPRLSPDTVHRRFHSPLHALPAETVDSGQGIGPVRRVHPRATFTRDDDVLAVASPVSIPEGRQP